MFENLPHVRGRRLEEPIDITLTRVQCNSSRLPASPRSVTPTARAAADEVACGVGTKGGLRDCASVQADGDCVLLLDGPVAHQMAVLWAPFGARATSRMLEDNRCNHRIFS